MILSQLALVSWALIAAQQAAAPASPAAPDPGGISKEQAETLISKCGERRFEATADIPVNDKVRRTKLTLCAADGDTNADWVSKLEKAAAQIQAHPTYPAATKEKLLGDLRAEIERVKSGAVAEGPATGAAVAASSSIPVAAAPPIVATPRLPPKSPLADFNALPPLPRAPAVAATPTKVATAVAATAPARRGPQLSVRCAVAGDDRTQRCGMIASDERLVVRATEPFDGPVSLRFVRNGGDVSEEVAFASRSLKAGQTARFRIPEEICAARLRAKFEIHAVSPVINGGRTGERVGSFETRCGV
jgi:hypothetical protein